MSSHWEAGCLQENRAALGGMKPCPGRMVSTRADVPIRWSLTWTDGRLSAVFRTLAGQWTADPDLEPVGSLGPETAT